MMKLLHDLMLDARTAEDVALTQEMVNDTKSLALAPFNPYAVPRPLGMGAVQVLARVAKLTL